MSLKQAAFLTSRVISLWFFCRALAMLVEVPAVFAMMSAFASLRNMPGFEPETAKLFASSGAIVVEGIGELFLAIIFYRFGPRVTQFLTGDGADASVVGVDSQNR